jgi:glycosyltransferase involved in cell wall biosynthesis
MKLTFVLPRYGREIFGGVEQEARQLAENVVSRSDWRVEVLTTCALDARTFSDTYPAGRTEESGVAVHRFPATGRAPDFDERSTEILFADPITRAARSDEWINMQGPVSPELIAAVRTAETDLMVFFPYLYHPTVEGLRAARGTPTMMRPATHDEQPLKLPVFQETFARVDSLLFASRSEQVLTNDRFAIGAKQQCVLGVGVEEHLGDETLARTALHLGEAPYVVCVGRVDQGKGSSLLADYFATYKHQHPSDLKLVFAGPVFHEPPAHPDIVVAGAVDESTKWGLLRGARTLISPSPLESFSIVLMEGWIAGLPVMVNGACHATRDHAVDSNGGLWFTNYDEFDAGLTRLLTQPDLARALGHNGKQYVERRYTWPILTDRYLAFCERVVGASTKIAPSAK